ncbi:MAG: metallophosphoesterase family protein [Gaiellaceae bacterium]
MTVAALYDVHGNLPALEAVLADVSDDAVIVVGGDVTAGPLPAETLERLRGLGDRVRWIRGNADRELTPSEPGLAPADVIGWVREQHTDEQIAFLHGLPARLELDVDGVGQVLFCHATPQNDTDIFLEGTPEEAVAPAFAGLDADLVVCGHTHMQFLREIAGIRVVNAGSVGMPYDDEPGAYWLALGPEVKHRRTAYDPAGLESSAFPGDYFRGGRPSRAEVTAYFEPHAVGA